MLTNTLEATGSLDGLPAMDLSQYAYPDKASKKCGLIKIRREEIEELQAKIEPLCKSILENPHFFALKIQSTYDRINSIKVELSELGLCPIAGCPHGPPELPKKSGKRSRNPNSSSDWKFNWENSSDDDCSTGTGGDFITQKTSKQKAKKTPVVLDTKLIMAPAKLHFNQNTAIQTQNPFAILGLDSQSQDQSAEKADNVVTDLDGQSMEVSERLEESSAAKGGNDITIQDGQSREADNEQTEEMPSASPLQTTRKDKIDPVHVKIKTNFKALCMDIKSYVKEEPTFKAGGELIKVYFKTSDDYRKGTEKMKANGYEYYVISPLKTKPLKVVLKGLPPSTETKEIVEELEAKGFSVFRVSLMHRFKDRRPLPMFQVQLNPNPKNDEIYNLKLFQYLSIEVVKFERTGRVNQCYKCQGFYHSSDQCFIKPNCVKCAGPHLTANCDKKEEEPPTCINCNGKHPASYRGCKKFPKWTKKSLPKESYTQVQPRPQTRAPQAPSTRKTWNKISNPDPKEQVDTVEFPSLPSTSRQLPLESSGETPSSSENSTLNALLEYVKKLDKRMDEMSEAIKKMSQSKTVHE